MSIQTSPIYSLNAIVQQVLDENNVENKSGASVYSEATIDGVTDDGAAIESLKELLHRLPPEMRQEIRNKIKEVEEAEAKKEQSVEQMRRNTAKDDHSHNYHDINIEIAQEKKKQEEKEENEEPEKEQGGIEDGILMLLFNEITKGISTKNIVSATEETTEVDLSGFFEEMGDEEMWEFEDVASDEISTPQTPTAKAKSTEVGRE